MSFNHVPVILYGDDAGTHTLVAVDSNGYVKIQLASILGGVEFDLSDDLTRNVGKVIPANTVGTAIPTSPDYGNSALAVAPGYYPSSNHLTQLQTGASGELVLDSLPTGTNTIGSVKLTDGVDTLNIVEEILDSYKGFMSIGLTGGGGDAVAMIVDVDGHQQVDILEIANDYTRELGAVKIYGNGNLLDVFSPVGVTGGETGFLIAGYDFDDDTVRPLYIDNTTGYQVVKIGNEVTINDGTNNPDFLAFGDSYLAKRGLLALGGNPISGTVAPIPLLYEGQSFGSTQIAVPIIAWDGSNAQRVRATSNGYLYVQQASSSRTVSGSVQIRDEGGTYLTFSQGENTPWGGHDYSLVIAGVYDKSGSPWTKAIQVLDTGDVCIYNKVLESDLPSILAKLTTIDADTGNIYSKLTTIDQDTGYIRSYTLAMQTDLAAIEVLLTSMDTDTAAMVVDLANIESLISDLSQEEDQSHVDKDKGIMTLTVRDDSQSDNADTDADGDYTPLRVNNKGSLWTHPEIIHKSNAFGATGNVVYDLSLIPKKTFSLQVVKGTTSPATCVVSLQGSLDNANFYTIATYDLASDALGTIKTAVDVPVLYIKISCSTLTGGDVVAYFVGMP